MSQSNELLILEKALNEQQLLNHELKESQRQQAEEAEGGPQRREAQGQADAGPLPFLHGEEEPLLLDAPRRGQDFLWRSRV